MTNSLFTKHAKKKRREAHIARSRDSGNMGFVEVQSYSWLGIKAGDVIVGA